MLWNLVGIFLYIHSPQGRFHHTCPPLYSLVFPTLGTLNTTTWFFQHGHLEFFPERGILQLLSVEIGSRLGHQVWGSGSHVPKGYSRELCILPCLHSYMYSSLSLGCPSPRYLMGSGFQVLAVPWAEPVVPPVFPGPSVQPFTMGPSHWIAMVCLPSCSVNSWRAGVIFLSSVPQTVAAQKRHLLNEWKYGVRGLCRRTKEGATTRFTTWRMPNFCPPQTLFYKKCWLHPDLNPHSHSDSWGLLWLAGEWLLAGRTVAAGDVSGLCDLWETLYTQAGFTVVESKAHFLNQRVEEREPTWTMHCGRQVLKCISFYLYNHPAR